MNYTDKKLKIKHGKPLSEKKFIPLIDADLKDTVQLASILCEKMNASTKGRCLFKSLAPNTKRGKTLAEMRDNVCRIRIFIRSILDKNDL